MQKSVDALHQRRGFKKPKASLSIQGNGALNLRAVTYLKDMEKRAKERLLNYQYYLSKAFEYRTTKPCQVQWLSRRVLFRRSFPS